jgi:hypothetical protein
MEFIANQLSAVGQLERPVFDTTGLSGNFDFALEWTPERLAVQPAVTDLQPDPTGPNFLEAIKDQLGLKLESQKGPAQVLILDHVEHPSENRRGNNRTDAGTIASGNESIPHAGPGGSGPNLHKPTRGGNTTTQNAGFSKCQSYP